jgi:hypothetical protein
LGAFIVRIAGCIEPWGPDQGIFATDGWALQRGLTLYRDVWDQKPPGIHLAYRVAFAVFGHHVAASFWLDYLAAAATVCALFVLGRRARSASFGALVAATYAIGTLPAARLYFGGFLERAIPETFIVLFAACAVCATTFATAESRAPWSFIAGVSLGIAIVFKPTAVLYWPALVVWFWWTRQANVWRYVWSSASGAAIAPIAVIAWLGWHGVLADARVAVIDYNRAYLSASASSAWALANAFAHEVWRRVKTDELWCLGIASGGIAALGVLRRLTRPDPVAALGLLWLAASLTAVIANGARAYPTYFIPPLVPLCLLFAWALASLPQGWPRIVACAVVVVLASESGSIVHAWQETAWDLGGLTGRLDGKTYLSRFRSRDGRAFAADVNVELAAYLQSHTDPADRIYVFGMTAGTYFLSQRLPASRFVWVYPPVSGLLAQPEFQPEALAADLRASAPRYIVLQRYNADSGSGWHVEHAFALPAIADVLRTYREETSIGQFVLYRIVALPSP